MDKHYSIGDCAKICGVSVQTLRYYGKIGLVEPTYVKGDTGYRFYTSDQFQLIHRVKYLQHLGFSLIQIKEMVSRKTAGATLEALKKHREIIYQEQMHYQKLTEEIDWYIDYFNTAIEGCYNSIPYLKTFPKRKALIGPYDYYSRSDHEGYINLLTLYNETYDQEIPLRFQFIYTWDYQTMIERKYEPNQIGLIMEDDYPIETPNIYTIPAGKYICFRAELMKNDWTPDLAVKFLPAGFTPSLIIAAEHEAHLFDYSISVYEVQIYIGAEKKLELA